MSSTFSGYFTNFPRWFLVIVLPVALVSSGCAHIDQFEGPTPSFDINKDVREFSDKFGSATSIAAYYSVASGTETRSARDAFITGRLTLYDLQYARYVHQFALGRAEAQSGFDISKLAVDLSTTVVGGLRDKTVLGAVSAGLTGSRLSIEKNFFDERTSQALVSQMNANRKVALVPILAGLSQGVDAYPLSRALIDLHFYYEAGTLQGALLSVQADAGKQAATADQQLEQFRVIAFTMDPAALSLERWLRPTAVSRSSTGLFTDAAGQTAPVDEARRGSLNKWLSDNGFNGVPIPSFIRLNDAFAHQAAKTALKVPDPS